MRVWIVEDAPAYEPSTRHGVFVSPNAAADAWNEKVKNLANGAYRVEFSLTTLDGVVTLEADRNGDTVTMSGEQVEGMNAAAPTVADWRSLKGLLAAAVRSITSAEASHLDEWVEGDKYTDGSWTIDRNYDLRW